MKPRLPIILRTIAALLAGAACGAGIKYLLAPGADIAAARQTPAPPRGMEGTASGAGPRVSAAARLSEIERLDLRDYPLYSKAWLAAFADTAKQAIEENPAAAAEAFLHSPKLQKAAAVEVFTALLGEADPMLAMDFASRLPRRFHERLQWMVYSAVIRKDPDRALQLIRAGALKNVPPNASCSTFGWAVAEGGDLAASLAFLRKTFTGEDLQSSLTGFCDSLGWSDPRAAAAAAADYPDLVPHLLPLAAHTLWRIGEVKASFDCVPKLDAAKAQQTVKGMVEYLHSIPPGALMPAFTGLLELSVRDSKLLPSGQWQMACERIRRRLAEEYPERLPEFIRAAPEGPVRRLFETGKWPPESGR